MKRIAMTLAFLSASMLVVGPAAADEYYYQQAYPVGYPASYQQPNNHEVLKKVLIGGALVGIGFLAGRLTAPRDDYPPPVFQPPIGQPPVVYPHGGSHQHRPHIQTQYRPSFGSQFQHRSSNFRGPTSLEARRF